jgi:eukaryotic-like serine/threonine-protein kinase
VSLERLRASLADRYSIERELGAGGMATVYLAADLKHGRKVAVKVLKPELAAVLGAERFVVEIKTTAALQHPHILPLFDSGECDGFLYYVMPYIQGETLRAKLDRETQLSIDEAVKLTVAVADALDYAHRQGVIHRDIKPENILLHDGRPMVADFGIALAVSAAAGGRMTETGLSLGTPHYMSPEQATAEKEITARSDVYSLASVLYEMLTGNPPHVGASAQQIIMKIVTEEAAPVTKLRKSVPPNVAAALAKGLEKLPADRFASAADFAAALTSAGFTVPMTAASHAAAPRDGRWNRLGLLGWGVAAAAVVAALWGWLRPEPPRPVSRYGLAFADGQAPLGGFAITPDGSRLVYQGPGDSVQQRQLWVKRREEYSAAPLLGTTNASVPFISPDGEWIAFAQNFQLKKMPITGGAITTLVDSALGSAGVAWLDDGTIVYVQRGTFNLMRVSEAGGPSTLVRAPEAQGRGLVRPAALPRGRGLLFSSCSSNCLSSDLWVLDLESGDARVLIPGERGGAYLHSGHVAYGAKDGQIYAAPFDLKALQFRSTPVPVFGGGVMGSTVSSTGTAVIEVGSATAGGSWGQHTLVWVDRAGVQVPVDSAWTFRPSQSGGNVGWALSPDGTRLAVGINSDAGDDIWIKQLPAGPLSRLTFDSGPEARPRWTPDGRSVTYTVLADSSVRERPADGTGTETTRLVMRGHQINEGFWSRDGQWLVARTGNDGSQRDIIGLRPGVDSAPIPLAANPRYHESAAALSPDGKWLAYESNETGTEQVYLRPFPNVDGGKWQVSTNGGQAPLWAHSGRELFFVDADRNMVAVPVTSGPTPALGDRQVLFHLDDDVYLGRPEHYATIDISRDDRRFLMARRVTDGQAAAPTFVLVENWFEELKAKVKP